MPIAGGVHAGVPAEDYRKFATEAAPQGWLRYAAVGAAGPGPNIK